MLLLALFCASAGACGDESLTGPAPEITSLPRALSQNEVMVVGAGNDFAFRFLDQVYQTAPDSNLFLAPLSASMALGMTMNGAAGSTLDEMRNTLGFQGMSLDQINQGYRDLIDLLLGLDRSVEIGIGNSIWYREGLPVRADFLDRTSSYFDAEVSALDFGNPGAANIINSWVNDATREKIEAIVDPPIHPTTIMFLINAIYFKGDWTHRFPKNKTTQANFVSINGAAGPVPLMELKDTLLYAETNDYQAVDLPYGGKAFSMTVLLPRPNVPMREFVASLDPTRWAQILESLTEKEGTVYLPRFRMDWERELNDDLQAMGMNAPFGGGADFTGLCHEALQRGIYISKVKQKTYVDVNEEGTEAAGVTSVELREFANPDHFVVRADRPFLFVIRERFSETVLFTGVLVAPPES
jgi:serpin B